MSAQLNHEQAFELLPWLVNGTLTGSELDSVQVHVRDCLTCRVALREQQQLRAAIQEQPTVPLSAEQGFDRLLRQMDGPAPGHAQGAAQRRFGLAVAPLWTRAAAAAVALIAVGAGAWIAVDGGDREAAEFATLARNTTIEDVRLDVIFAESVTEADMRAVLSEVDGNIVAGPSPLGRYTIRLNATDLTATDVGELIERLGRDERIRFAGRSMIEEQAE